MGKPSENERAPVSGIGDPELRLRMTLEAIQLPQNRSSLCETLPNESHTEARASLFYSLQKSPSGAFMLLPMVR